SAAAIAAARSSGPRRPPPAGFTSWGCSTCWRASAWAGSRLARPSASPNVAEGFAVAGLGFGTAEYFHLIAEVLKIGFADRDASTGDPDFLDIPVARLISKEYAEARRARAHHA